MAGRSWRARLRSARTRPIALSVVATIAVVGVVIATVGAGGAGRSDSEASSVADVLMLTPGMGPTQAVLALAGGTLTPAEAGLVAPDGTRLTGLTVVGDDDLPVVAKRAYVRAAREEDQVRPACDLAWEVLAGIGRVESDHGRADGSVLGSDGISRPPIIGVALDGVGGVALVRDTDHGRLDHDRRYDRAVGPMQFLPSTWAQVGMDGDGDGRADVEDINDAARSAAALLCPASGSFSDPATLRAAIYSYNHSDYYVDLVLAFARGYRTGVFDIPPPPAATTTATTTAGPSASTSPSAPTTTVSSGSPATPTETPTRSNPPSSSPTRQPTRIPSASPHPTPTPSTTSSPSSSPTSPPAEAGSGVWTPCGGTWCLNAHVLDLGGSSRYGVMAAHDYDGDGTIETNQQEFDGLVGQSVRVTVIVASGDLVVYAINGQAYRNADGSFTS